MKIIKVLLGLMLALSLTLPLSTCTGTVKEGDTSEPPRIERYVLSDTSELTDWLWAASFLLPFGLAIFSVFRDKSIWLELLSLASLMPASYLLWAHNAIGELAAGGLLALASIIGLLAIGTYLLIKQLMSKKTAIADDREANK